MDTSSIQEEMRVLCQTKKWRELMDLLDSGYKGMYVILRILKESEKAVVPGELARRMNVSTARIARALKTLEKKNYIRRESEKNDARKVIVLLTHDGEKALEERKAIVDAMIESLLKNLTEEETRTGFRLLKKMLQ